MTVVALIIAWAAVCLAAYAVVRKGNRRFGSHRHHSYWQTGRRIRW